MPEMKNNKDREYTSLELKKIERLVRDNWKKNKKQPLGKFIFYKYKEDER